MADYLNPYRRRTQTAGSSDEYTRRRDHNAALDFRNGKRARIGGPTVQSTRNNADPYADAKRAAITSAEGRAASRGGIPTQKEYQDAEWGAQFTKTPTPSVTPQPTPPQAQSPQLVAPTARQQAVVAGQRDAQRRGFRMTNSPGTVMMNPGHEVTPQPGRTLNYERSNDLAGTMGVDPYSIPVGARGRSDQYGGGYATNGGPAKPIAELHQPNWQEQIATAHPAIGKAGTPENAAFVEAFNVKPEYYAANPTEAIILAKAIADSLKRPEPERIASNASQDYINAYAA